MRTKTKLTLAMALLSIGTVTAVQTDVIAADHIDASDVQADLAADITDFYAWSDGENVTAILAYAGLQEAGTRGTYDEGVLYGIHIDNDGDGVADRDIWIRYGQDENDSWGMQVTGLEDAPIVAPVEEITEGDGTRIFAGSRDDGFFFDFEGFGATLMEGTLMFDNTRDSFAGTNTSAIALEGPLSAFTDGETAFTIWATTRRAQ